VFAIIAIPIDEISSIENVKTRTQSARAWRIRSDLIAIVSVLGLNVNEIIWQKLRDDIHAVHNSPRWNFKTVKRLRKLCITDERRSERTQERDI
jgi:hypothetical protein